MAKNGMLLVTLANIWLPNISNIQRGMENCVWKSLPRSDRGIDINEVHTSLQSTMVLSSSTCDSLRSQMFTTLLSLFTCSFRRFFCVAWTSWVQCVNEWNKAHHLNYQKIKFTYNIFMRSTCKRPSKWPQCIMHFMSEINRTYSLHMTPWSSSALIVSIPWNSWEILATAFLLSLC